MNTPAHLIFAAALYARPGKPQVNAAALAGGFAPDASLYFLYAWARFVQGIPDRVIFGELYFGPEWQGVFAVDNSFFLWGGLFALAWWSRLPAAIAFAGSGLLHLALDFPLHHDDGRAHFWPMSDWIFRSPLSYWDSRHHGDIVGGLEVLACMLLLAVLWRRFSGTPARALIGLSAAGLAAPALIFGIMFG